jgi:hypothetical protein
MTVDIRQVPYTSAALPHFLNRISFRADDLHCVRNWRIAAVQNPLGFTVNLRLTSEVETKNRNQ